jgi:hypothetical protein
MLSILRGIEDKYMKNARFELTVSIGPTDHHDARPRL